MNNRENEINRPALEFAFLSDKKKLLTGGKGRDRRGKRNVGRVIYQVRYRAC